MIGVMMVKNFTDLIDDSAAHLKKEAESALDLSGEFKTHAKDNDVLLGLESKAKAGIQERGAALARSVLEIRENEAKKGKQRTDDIMLIVLLDDIRKKAQEAEEFLQREFGENYLVMLSQQYGVDITGMTHQQAVKALATEFSKDKYKDDAIVQKALPALQLKVKGADLENRFNEAHQTAEGPSAELYEEAHEFIEGEDTTLQALREFKDNNQDISLVKAAEGEINSRFVSDKPEVKTSYTADTLSFG